MDNQPVVAFGCVPFIVRRLIDMDDPPDIAAIRSGLGYVRQPSRPIAGCPGYLNATNMPTVHQQLGFDYPC